MEQSQERGRLTFSPRRLTKTYQMGEMKIQVLGGLDIDLYEHEMVVIVGPSGSGKSTF